MPSTKPSAAGEGLPHIPLDAAIGQVFAPYCPGGHYGHQFQCKQIELWHCEVAFKASVQKAWNGPSTQPIQATSCVERSNAIIKAKALSYLSSYQMLATDKNCLSY